MFALAKDLEVKTAKVSDTLTIGGNMPAAGGVAATQKVNITSTADGLNFANVTADASGSKNVYLKGIATTLTEPSAGAKSSHVDLNVDATKNPMQQVLKMYCAQVGIFKVMVIMLIM